jgi:hypothetical protein
VARFRLRRRVGEPDEAGQFETSCGPRLRAASE